MLQGLRKGALTQCSLQAYLHAADAKQGLCDVLAIPLSLRPKLLRFRITWHFAPTSSVFASTRVRDQW